MKSIHILILILVISFSGMAQPPAPTNLSTSYIDEGSLVITWDMVAGASHYDLDISDDATFISILSSVSIPDNTTSFNGLVNDLTSLYTSEVL